VLFSRREAAVVILLAGIALAGGIVKYWRDYSAPVSVLVPANRSAISEADEPDAVSGGEVSVPVAAPEQDMDGPGPSSPGGKIDLNMATRDELEPLPGIGATLAQRIIDYRQQNGPFAATEDLQNVPGIGASRYDAIRELVTVN